MVGEFLRVVLVLVVGWVFRNDQVDQDGEEEEA